MEAPFQKYSLLEFKKEKVSSEVLTFSEEDKQTSENLYRLESVLSDLSLEVLKDVIPQLLHTDTLKEALQLNKSKIEELYEEHSFTTDQYDLLKEVPPQPEKFDIDLLVQILIHICPGVAVPPTGKSNYPDPTDFNLGADIVRLRCWRNKININYLQATDDYGEELWDEVEKALVRISKHGSKDLQNIQEKIEAMKTGPLRARPALPRMVEEILILNALFDLGSEVLRDVMLQRLQPNKLKEKIQSDKSWIDELYKEHIISPHDYDLLKEPSPEPEKFNIRLLVNILTHLYSGVKILPTGVGLIALLGPTDCTLEADIQRLNILIFNFLNKWSNTMTDDDVEKTWNEVETVLVGISKHGSKVNIHERIEARKTSKLRAVQARKGFIDLLKETPDIDMYSHWDDVIPKIGTEHRYMAVDNDLLREIFFIENKLDMIKEDFTQLLNSVPDIDKHTKWNDVKHRVKKDPRYMMISDVIADQDAKCFEKLFTMEQWFFDYKRDLDIHRASITEMHEVKKEVDTQYLGCKSWPAYLATDSDGAKLQTEKKHVIVVELPAEIISRIEQDKPKLVRDTELVIKCPNDRSNEFAKCMHKTIYSKLNDENTEKKIIATIRKYRKVLHAKFSKLSEILLSKVKSRGFGKECANIEEKYCIALVVPYKGLIPISERPFPPTINGYPTDVWEGEVLPSYHPASHQSQRPLRMGSSLGVTYKVQRGPIDIPETTWLTIGPFIKLNKKTYILSVGHCTFDAENNLNTIIPLTTNAGMTCSQPMFGREFGTVVLRCFNWGEREDAALIEITDATMEPTTGYFPDTTDSFDMFNGCPLRFSSGRIIDRRDAPLSTDQDSATTFVIKYGAATGLTKGFICRQSAAHTHIFEVMNDKTETKFSEQGDSGALVLLVQRSDSCTVHAGKNRQGKCSCDIGALGIIIAVCRDAGITYCLYISDGLHMLDLQEWINGCILFNDQDSVPSLR